MASVRKLKHNAIETGYCPQNLDTRAQWIYVPDEERAFHRILVRHNFCAGSRGYWTETRHREGTEGDSCGFINPYAYPLNTIEKPQIMKKLLIFGSAKGIYGLGRWGEHSHHNSDVVVEHAMALAERLAGV